MNPQSLSEVGLRFENAAAIAPVLLIGVPRSGTTLFGVPPDSHWRIAILPKTPWSFGAYGPDSALRTLPQDIIDGFRRMRWAAIYGNLSQRWK